MSSSTEEPDEGRASSVGREKNRAAAVRQSVRRSLLVMVVAVSGAKLRKRIDIKAASLNTAFIR
jgi:hypothetical protein